jgi:hypothetical protein
MHMQNAFRKQRHVFESHSYNPKLKVYDILYNIRFQVGFLQAPAGLARQEPNATKHFEPALSYLGQDHHHHHHHFCFHRSYRHNRFAFVFDILLRLR